MFWNNCKVAFKHLLAHRLYLAINVLGLAIGLACCLLIILFVRHELSYEAGFENAEHIYRVSRQYAANYGARRRVPASANAPVAPALLREFEDIEAAGRIFAGGTLLEREEFSFSEPAVRFADQGIVQVFDFDWLAGNPEGALVAPNTIVLTESLARKYFGSAAAALGEGIGILGQGKARVSGVIRDLPPNTHLSLSGMVSLATLSAMMGDQLQQGWNGNTDYHTYFRLGEAVAVDTVVPRLPDLLARYAGEEAAAMSSLPVMNIRDIHLQSDRDEEWKPGGSLGTVYSFSAIALGILLIACSNFMSIATAFSTQRSKEVGMRKTIGATRRQLVYQHLGESLLTAAIAMLMAILLVEIILPSFGAFVGTDFRFDYFRDGQLLEILLGLTLLTGLLAGSYPAFYLSGFKPASIFRGERGRGGSGLRFRNVLVVLQFAIAITLVISTAVIYKQRAYAAQMELGFDKDRVVILTSSAPQGFRQDWQVLKQELLSHSAIENVTASHYLPFGFNDNQIPLELRGSTLQTRIQYMVVDFDFFATYDIAFLAGRSFSASMGTDAMASLAEDNATGTVFILNAAAERALGLSRGESVNRVVEVPGSPITGPVLGVVDDTYFESIRNDVRPLIFVLAPPFVEQNLQVFRNGAVKMAAGAVPEALAHIDATWAGLYPEQALNRRFLDEDFQAMYLAEERQGQLFTWFSILAILIACFGLYGLASFNAERRTKEIGVRKVMGGGVWRIVLLLTKDFSRLVLLSNLIAWPVAYVAMDRWLENFAYRIDLAPLIFIGSGLIALCIAWVTVGGTAAKAASQKPVLALRYE